MSMPTTEQEQQPFSKILDADLDAAMILNESALLSKYCAEKAERAGVDCYKCCRTYADLAHQAAWLLVSAGSESLGIHQHAVTSSPPPAGESMAPPSDLGDRAHHLATDALDYSGVLALVLSSAERVHAHCGSHTEHAHCQACAAAAGRAHAVLREILAARKQARHPHYATDPHGTATVGAGRGAVPHGPAPMHRGGQQVGSDEKKAWQPPETDKGELRLGRGAKQLRDVAAGGEAQKRAVEE
ncbi:hypothetical protein H9P43_007107 [Blastocladiella emersonii ATCC 22665]|nr:hypothetical protein H9P43_007070 [Blastocladiella emersonii ATCC 22665]KAI9172976.1 hypothetical protein H9P43_007107 [Blastocladiella emersonii ATCC 22665]